LPAWTGLRRRDNALSDLGEVDALIYNAGSGVWGNVEEVKAEDLERSWRINTHSGCFSAASI
jgi:NAD(P)-dependent dehydrogenase (short-subunit alcohol dehydrogenase family)